MTSSGVKRGVSDAATNLWGTLARGVGRLGGWNPTAWHSPGAQRVLVVAPHPDDEIACGGTLILHRRAGDAVHVAYVTDGRASLAGGLGAEEMAARRRAEARAAGAALDVSGSHWLGLREREWDGPLLVQMLGDLVRQTAPHILYAPSCVDFHPEHIRVAAALARALSSGSPALLKVRVYEIQVPLTPLLVNVLAPVGAVLSELAAAMHCYVTQFGSIERTLRMRYYAASLFRRAELVEGFWEMDADTYRHVHGERRELSRDAAFRSVRARPFTDPLAYLLRLGARRGLRELARTR